MDIVTGAEGFIGSHLVSELKNPLKCDVKSLNSTHPTDLFYRIKHKNYISPRRYFFYY